MGLVYVTNLNIHLRNAKERKQSFDDMDQLEQRQDGRLIINLTFPDYVDDPRPIWEIDEIRLFFLKLLQKQPQWLRYFSDDTATHAEFCCNIQHDKHFNASIKKFIHSTALTVEWLDICKRAGLDPMTTQTDENRLLPMVKARG